MHKGPSRARQCELLGIARSTSYYKHQEGEKPENLKMMELMDKQYDRCPAMGVRQMVDYLKGEGYHVGRKLVRRLMALMGLMAVYPLKSLSKGGWIKYRMPYLLRGMRISMDGRARCLDNVWIERFWRTIKREYVYLNPESTVQALRNGIRKYIDYYNNRRCHQGLRHQVPGAVYAAA